MPSSEEILEIATSVIHEIDHYGVGAPFIAYVKAENHGNLEHIFVSRETVLTSQAPSDLNVIYARYRLPLGKIAETPPGSIATVRVRNFIGLRPTDTITETKYQILARDRFRIKWSNGIADAIDNELTFPTENLHLDVLRAWINRTQEEIAHEAAKPRRRRMAERLELADIPVVDSLQGEIWRKNIRRFIVITGAPGTGKTTTAIKRLAQKTDPSALKQEISESEEILREWLGGTKSWILFTPSELLRNYLHQALADENLPATEDRVPLWKDTKRRIGRDDLRLFGQGRFFSLIPDEDLVEACDSASLASWTTGFHKRFSRRIHAELRRAVTEQAALLDGSLRALKDRLETLRNEMEPLRSQQLLLEDQLSQARSDQDREEAGRKLRQIELELAPRVDLANVIETVNKTWGSMERLGRTPEDAPLGATLREIFSLRSKFDQIRQRLEISSLAIADLIEVNQFIAAGSSLLRLFSDDSDDSLDAIFRKLPIVYHEYRLRASEETRFYLHSALAEVNNRRLAPLELDSVIYVALRLLREVFGHRLPQGPGISITRRLANEFRYVIAVDEATDFSVVELACIRLLAHPVFNCVTFAGDPMQRLTGRGIRDWTDLESLFDEMPEVCELRHSYRQSKRLLGIASKLFEKSVGRPAQFEAGFQDGADDPEALRYKATSFDDEAEWLVKRIGEIYSVCGEQLPSIALITPEEQDVKPLADRLKDPLRDLFGIETEDCPQGRILGTQAKVRVFSVQFIKGLEFESVFFVGIGRMATSTPELVDRYLYVGLTRARSFLAVTHTGEFPVELSHVTQCFAEGDWRRLIPQQASA